MATLESLQIAMKLDNWTEDNIKFVEERFRKYTVDRKEDDFWPAIKNRVGIDKHNKLVSMAGTYHKSSADVKAKLRQRANELQKDGPKFINVIKPQSAQIERAKEQMMMNAFFQEELKRQEKIDKQQEDLKKQQEELKKQLKIKDEELEKYKCSIEDKEKQLNEYKFQLEAQKQSLNQQDWLAKLDVIKHEIDNLKNRENEYRMIGYLCNQDHITHGNPAKSPNGELCCPFVYSNGKSCSYSVRELYLK